MSRSLRTERGLRVIAWLVMNMIALRTTLLRSSRAAKSDISNTVKSLDRSSVAAPSKKAP
jgi:hypothetical protein